MPDQPTPLPDTQPATIAWIAPTEGGRAQQLLATQPHLLTANKELDWLPNLQLLAHAQEHVALTGTKAGLAANRPAQTVELSQTVEAMRKPLTELRGLMKKKFKDNYQSYYPQFGLKQIGKNWRLPDDRDELLIAVRDFLIPALTTYGFQGDADTGTAVWQLLLQRLQTGLLGAGKTDADRSVAVGQSSPLDIVTEKALRSLYHLAIAHNPDTWESVLRGWGWRKTSF